LRGDTSKGREGEREGKRGKGGRAAPPKYFGLEPPLPALGN